MELSARLVEISAVKKKLTVEIPAETATGELEKMAERVRRQVALPGFRRGKAPMALIKRRYAADIREEVLQSIVPVSLEQAIEENGLRPAGRPRVDGISFEPGRPLSYEVEVEVYPEILLGQYRGLEVTVPSPEVKAEEIQERLEKLREEHAQLVPVEDRPVMLGDSVVIDLVGEYADVEDGKPAGEPVTQEDVTVDVGASSTFQAFTDALVGTNIGEERSFEVEYPPDYQSERLAGRKISFRVEVTDIRKRELPELNDDFAKDLGEFESLEEVRGRIRSDLERAAKQTRESEIRSAVRTRLVQSCSFEVPEVLVESEIRQRLETAARNLAYQGIDPARARIDWRKVREDVKPVAEEAVRADLILDEIAKAENIKVTEADLEAEIDRMSEGSNEAPEKVRALMARDEARRMLQLEMTRGRALQLVIDTASIL